MKEETDATILELLQQADKKYKKAIKQLYIIIGIIIVVLFIASLIII